MAPSSRPISQKVEMERFERYLLPLLKTWDKKIDLSIDTFRPEVFKWLYDQNPGLNWIFNDVSGHLDEAILDTCPNARVVLGHNLCPNREEAPYHLKYGLSAEESLLDHMEEFFKSKNITSRVILDPLFGFSKSFEQNMQLLKKLPEFIKRFSPEQKILIGISKKSFLRKSIPESADPLDDSEYLHLLYLSHYIRELKQQNLIFRVHDPKIWSFASNWRYDEK